MDLQDMHQLSSAGNRYLLVVVDKVSKFVPVWLPLTLEGGCRCEQETDGAYVEVRRSGQNPE